MPKLGLSMKAGTISSWRAQDGQAVETGQTLFVVETDKINMEIEATAAGTLKHAEAEGVTVPVGQLIAFILAPGEDVPADELVAAPGGSGAEAGAAAPAAAASAASPAGGRSSGRVLASPVARKLADQLGVDLATVAGTGPGGRIVKEDVEAAAARGPEPAAAPAGSDPAPASDQDERRPLSQMRQTIAERMTASLRDSAQLTIGTDVDVTDLATLIESMSDGPADEPAPTITDYLVLAVARALRKHPGINASLDGDEVVVHGAVHLGLAVALTDGLVVPVLRDVHRMSIGDISTTRRTLADAARGGRLGLDDLTGSTFTISSLGQSRVTWFTPIINPPEAAILGVGRATDQVRWVAGAAAPRRVLPLSLTVDHRIIDGAPAAAFLDELALSLSEPLRLLA
jgi:pyruvate dehydrogenase E2 component (dihydrolipoamide acetyltransferase)